MARRPSNVSPIPGFPGYFITRSGEIWSEMRRTGKWLKLKLDKSGHYQATLAVGRQPHFVQVHRLVLETFDGPCPDGMECRHLNGKPGDNRFENLRWGTRSENAFDKVKHGNCPFSGSGIHYNRDGEKNPNSKLTEQQVRQIIYTHATRLFTQQEIADQYAVNRSQIGGIVRRETWRHIWQKS